MHLLLFVLLFQASGFNAIKVGMKDTQVEQLVGLPIEITRGFSELDGYSVERKGQLNYICWKYKKTKRKILDTMDVDIKEDRIVSMHIDTSYHIPGTGYFSLAEILSSVDDTLYYFKPYYLSKRRIVSKEDYYQGLLYSSDKNSYHCTSTKLKTMEIDTTDIEKESYVTSVVKVQHILIQNQCVLFDPSSNRVVNVDYYPTSVERKILSNK